MSASPVRPALELAMHLAALPVEQREPELEAALLDLVDRAERREREAEALAHAAVGARSRVESLRAAAERLDRARLELAVAARAVHERAGAGVSPLGRAAGRFLVALGLGESFAGDQVRREIAAARSGLEEIEAWFADAENARRSS